MGWLENLLNVSIFIFSERNTHLKGFSVLDRRNLPNNREELKDYGNDSIVLLSNFYGWELPPLPLRSGMVESCHAHREATIFL